MEGKIEQPTTMSVITRSTPITASIVYPHIDKNIITGIYFKQYIAVLWFFIKVFIICIRFKIKLNQH